MFYSELCEISKNTFFTVHLRWLLLRFILVASIVVTWVSWFSRHRFKLKAEDFIFQILQRNFPNFRLPNFQFLVLSVTLLAFSQFTRNFRSIITGFLSFLIIICKEMNFICKAICILLRSFICSRK